MKSNDLECNQTQEVGPEWEDDNFWEDTNQPEWEDVDYWETAT